jgi:hypothetical protein
VSKSRNAMFSSSSSSSSKNSQLSVVKSHLQSHHLSLAQEIVVCAK